MGIGRRTCGRDREWGGNGGQNGGGRAGAAHWGIQRRGTAGNLLVVLGEAIGGGGHGEAGVVPGEIRNEEAVGARPRPVPSAIVSGVH